MMRRLSPARLALAVLVAGVAAPPASARPSRTERDLATTERDRARAEANATEAQARGEAAAAEERRLAEARVAAAAALVDTEQQVADLSDQMEALTTARDEAAARLAQRGQAIAPLLPLMERLAIYPAETLLAIPAPPEQTLRGLAVLRGLARMLEQEAAALRQEQAQLDADQRAMDDTLTRLRAAQAEQARQAHNLDQQIAAARALRLGAEQAGTEASRRVAASASRASSLRAALEALEAGRARAEEQARRDAVRAETRRETQAAQDARKREAVLAPAPASGDAARLVAPVAGGIARAWGAPTDAGPATGVSYRPASEARVVAPCGGRVRFAGPFRSYGTLIILDCGRGYAFVLAGLGRLDVVVGASVLVGEPVGAMPVWDGGAGARPALYVELRHDGEAVDPIPFLRTRS